jgi:two-component system nitrate/nitrite response regulator NarL
MTAKLIASMRAPKAAPVPAPAVAADPLTTRERDIMRELSHGASNKEIARSLMLAESTVKIHVRNILRKLNLTSRVQVAIYAVGHDAVQATEAV